MCKFLIFPWFSPLNCYISGLNEPILLKFEIRDIESSNFLISNHDVGRSIPILPVTC